MRPGDAAVHVTNGTRYRIDSGPFVGRHGHEYVWARTVYANQLGARFRLAAEKVRVESEESPTEESRHMTKYPDLFLALTEPFDKGEIKSFSKGGKTITYVTARTVMNRLDAVLGPENWSDEYTPLEHSVVCKLTLRLPGGESITKCDAGGYAGMSDQGDDDKSGFSDSFKRAAAKFGVGRYLYRDGVPRYDAAAEAPPAATDEQRARRKALDDVAKPLGALVADSIDAATHRAGPDSAGVPGFHQAHRHLLKWAVGEGWLPDPGSIQQDECVDLLNKLWEAADRKARAILRLELLGYLGRTPEMAGATSRN